ncbi:b5 reductase 1 [Seminavis robusta]|uniref:B5 reductase 1 n=1 Tax=Seminavis robusta TaxID=568900 RepID=A0A9N8H679_9STRA|nr:b5 reductase 1 [Seminavis robusta]|eukprot:Sro92_g048140.1 b5 reductase 1 (308) ;mRNA; f:70382-71305
MSSASKKRKSDEEDTPEEEEGRTEKKKSKKDKKKKEKHFWKGWPTKLIRKVTLVNEAEDRLPVHTLTFEIPTPATSSSSTTTSEDKMIPHTSVCMELGDVVKMVIPGYKPKSYSMCRKTDQEFDLTLKVYPDGRASGYLDRLAVGDTVGSFGLRKNKQHNPGAFVGIICFGVGITEGLPVARAQLALEDGTTKVVLLWASRTTADTFWKDSIQQLQEQYPNKFQMVHILSREEKEECLHGRINPQILGQVFRPDDKAQARFVSVGTKEMMKQTDQMLLQLGYTFPQNLLLPKQQEETKEGGKQEEED